MALAIAAVAVLAIRAAPSEAARPTLDSTFGVGGLARTPLEPAYDPESLTEVAAAPDGGALARSERFGPIEVLRFGADGSDLGIEKREHGPPLQPPEATAADGGRVVGVVIEREGELKSAVARYLPDGSRDGSFGRDGISEAFPFEVEAVAALDSGKVLAAGEGILQEVGIKSPEVDQIVVARLGADGKLDPSFGKGGLVALGGEDKVPDPEAIHVQGRGGDGAEVVGPETIVALDASGRLAPGFAKGGKLTMEGSVDGAAAAADEGLAVIGTRPAGGSRGRSSAEGPQEFYAARYTASGALDTAYAGGAGIASLDPGGLRRAGAPLFEADGAIVAGGLIEAGSICPPGYGCGPTPVLVRFDPEGRPDASFGQDGVVPLTKLGVPIGSPTSPAGVEALAPRPGGGVLAGGEAESASFVAAIAPDGSPAPGFGEEGIAVRTDPRPATSYPVAAGVDGAGDTFVIAETDSGMWLNEGFVVLKYLPGGELDRTYGEGGKAYVPPGAQSLAVAPDGAVYATSASESTLTRLTPAGALDRSFGTEGIVYLSKGAHHRITPWTLARLDDGRLLVGAEVGTKGGTPQTAVLSYGPDGAIDPTFGDQGTAMIDSGNSQAWQVRTMRVDDDGGILLAGSAAPRHRRHCCGESGLVIRLGADGRLDESFGRDGVALLRGGSRTAVEALAGRGGHILVAGALIEHPYGNFLASLDRHGHLDRGFAHRGIARVPISAHESEGGSVQVFSARRRILLVHAGRGAPLVSFSPRGLRERAFARGLNLVPGRDLEDTPASPVAAPAEGGLILAWPNRRDETSLQRLLVP